MSALASHLVVAPIVLPLVTAGVLLLLGERRSQVRALVNVASTIAGLVVAALLLRRVDAGGAAGEVGVYLASNWEAPFGIVLVVDRLAALMLVLVGVVAVAAATYAEAAWSRAGVYFHPLFQIQLMGLNGAFLTGDLFNLFVFFEVMLAASYGLQLHGSGWPRVRAGLHYVAVNLLASALFLIGLAVIYGVVGTLNMADVAAKAAQIAARDRGLFHAGAAVLSVAFLIKAAAWPLNAWLVPAYVAASAPVAALFALMTKVGVYTLLRLWTLLVADGAGPSGSFGQPVLLYGGIATLTFGAIGLVASMRLGAIASYAIIVSAGTLLAAAGTGAAPVMSAGLFYMVSATLAVSALFLVVEVIERRGVEGDRLRPDVDVAPDEDTNLDDAELPLVGRVFPVSLALLGIAFVASVLLVAGLPPLSGFVAKLALLEAVLRSGDGGGAPSPAGWLLFAALLASGLAALFALSRAGIRHFWSSGGRFEPRLKATEALAVAGLLASCVALTVLAEPVLRYTRDAAASLQAPRSYLEAVTAARSRPGPTSPPADAERDR